MRLRCAPLWRPFVAAPVQQRLVLPIGKMVVCVDHQLQAAANFWQQRHHLHAVADEEPAALLVHVGLGYAECGLRKAEKLGLPAQ